MKHLNAKILSGVCFAFLLCGCGKMEEMPGDIKAPALPNVQANIQSLPPKIEPVKYFYRGDKYRDPFISLSGEGIIYSSIEEIQIPNLSSLKLKGVFDDGKYKMALIAGGGVTYMLKDSLLYDSRSRLIKGFSGIVKADRVILTASDKTTKELILREKE